MKKINRIITVILCCVTVMMSGIVFAHAENSAQAAISVSPTSVKEGTEFTVTAKFTSSVSMGSVDAILKYDSSIVAFVSGQDAHDSSGVVKLSKWSQSESGDKSFTFSLKFKAKKAGSGSFSMKDTEISDFDFINMKVNDASASVTVTADVPLSSNNYLSGIKLSTGELSPKFNKNTVSYTVNVPNETDTLRITATCEDSKAKNSISGTSSLKVGTNTRKITVTAENGSKKTYTVKIIRAAAEGEPPVSSEAESLPPTESQTPTINIFIDGAEFIINENYDSVVIPDGFAETVCTVNGTQVMAVANSTNAIIMLHLEDSEGNGEFYIYDQAEITYIPYRTLTVGGITYIPLSKPRGLSVPSGFSSAELTVGEQTYSAWIHEADAEFYMLYLCNINGTPALYMYDTAEGTIMRYLNLKEPSTGEDDTSVSSPKPITQINNLHIYIVIAVLIAIIVVLNVVLIVFIVKYSRVLKNRAPSKQNELEFNDSDFAPVEDAYTATYEQSEAVEAETAKAETVEVNEDAPDGDSSFGDDFIIR